MVGASAKNERAVSLSVVFNPGHHVARVGTAVLRPSGQGSHSSITRRHTLPLGRQSAVGCAGTYDDPVTSIAAFGAQEEPPREVAPACSSIVSPQNALSKAACKSSPGRTETMLPGAGVSVIELVTVTRGSSAGPSKLPLAQAGENANTRNETAIRESDANDCMGRLLLFCVHRVCRGLAKPTASLTGIV